MAAGNEGWVYANNARIATTFLGLAMFFLGIGVLAVVAFRDDAALAGVAFLTLAVFLLVFSVLVFLPRLARRGAVSFSVYSSRSVEEVEAAVRSVIEASGRTPQVELVKSRSKHPPRIVTAEGIPARFRIEVTRHPARVDVGADWTEIVESFPSRDEAEAQALRDRITARLAGEAPPGR